MQLASKFALVVLLFTPLVTNATLMYSSVFTDNGNLVTETRTYSDHTETWEWLDLTITNGLTYNSIVADIANNGALDNSGSVLSGYTNSINDVLGLNTAQQTGWTTVSDQGVVDLYNSFFNLTLIDDDFYRFGRNTAIVEMFITMFGDTYHEGFLDAGIIYNDVAPYLPNIGYTYGYTDTKIYSDTHIEAAYVSDAQYYSKTYDSTFDYLSLGASLSANNVELAVGTYLNRKVNLMQVPEPGTFALFMLALIGMFLGRLRQRLPN